MSKYIDADFEIAHYTSMTTNPTPDVTEKDKRNSLIILDALRMAKTVDIVRCKECKHWSKYRTDGNQSYCEILCGYCDGDKFCAWGERKDDDD